MGQSTSDASEKDAHTMLDKEVCAIDMGQRSIDVVQKDVRTILKKEECA